MAQSISCGPLLKTRSKPEELEQVTWLRLTLTDAANMALMIRLGIAVAFSFDDDFPQAGFIRIPPFHF
jgi:predicted nucleic acid-binding protein